MTDQVLILLAHEAETGGGPQGLGLGSFITLMIGIVAIAYSLGRYLRAIRAGSPIGTKSSGEGSTECEHLAIPPAD